MKEISLDVWRQTAAQHCIKDPKLIQNILKEMQSMPLNVLFPLEMSDRDCGLSYGELILILNKDLNPKVNGQQVIADLSAMMAALSLLQKLCQSLIY